MTPYPAGRRTAGGLGVAVLAAGLIAGALTALPNDEAPVAGAPFVTRTVISAEENVIHYGDRDIQLGNNFQDVAAGVFATTRHNPSGHLVVSPDFGSDKPRFDGWHTDLSPDGRHLYTESGDIPRVYAAGSTTPLPLAHADHPLIVISQWLDNDRFVAVGIRDSELKPVMQPIDLVICSISTLKCEVTLPKVQPYPKTDAETGFRLPTGKRMS
ncbi:hypothetical protein [Kribbella deserti]|uniref:Uncharacterized protein n=1 Tax=Kribbella deserti TaxID=1926257 RepID=A0ABV6QMK9_9ACTN